MERLVDDFISSWIEFHKVLRKESKNLDIFLIAEAEG